jgi:hypothetical protein
MKFMDGLFLYSESTTGQPADGIAVDQKARGQHLV